jgi:hypothetical protein
MNLSYFTTTDRRATAAAAATTLTGIMFLGAMLPAHAQLTDTYRPQPAPGGIDSHPVITSITPSGSNVILSFKGLEAPYNTQVAPIGTTNWTSNATTTLKWPNFSGSVTATNVSGPGSQFRMNMLGQTFIGATRCYGCHDDEISQWLTTAHATALDALKDSSGNISASNLQNWAVYRSVGYGQPGGFVDPVSTPNLQNVGCENCHGPAGAHVSAGGTRNYHPAATVASEVCGGCHTTAQHPTYNEWASSPHATVTPDVGNATNGMANPTTGFARQMSCGPCHSGATRLAMLRNLQDMSYGITNALLLPSPSDAGYYGQTCATCHDPHSTNIGPHQLRSPVFSTDFYTFFTGADTRTNLSTNVFGGITTNLSYLNTVFATQYVATVQICAQCHNSRGALWTGTSRPPHESPQYNLLIGSLQPGYLNGKANYIGPHGLNTNGCVQCHLHQETVANPTDLSPNYTGHQFNVRLNGCTVSDCHDYGPTNVVADLLEGVQGDTAARIQFVVGLLNSWATNKAPSITNAFAAYGQYAWEFTTAGQLSNPTNNPAIVGPPTALQSKVPDLIKKARFNIYMVENDGSLGAHNIDYTRFLLKDARTNAQNALK